MANVRFEEILSYDPETGLLTWIISPAKHIKAGTIAGRVEIDGYIRVVYKGKNYQGHKVCWYLYYGDWPSFYIDHDDRIRNNNKIINLKKSSKLFNQWNRSDQSKYGPGIYRRRKKYVAKYKGIEIARVSTVAEAIYARLMCMQSEQIC